MDSPFWLFSRSIYGTPGVQRECLELQDSFGIDINLLLFCAFVGAVHGALWPCSEPDIAVPANIRTLFALGSTRAQQIALPENVVAAVRSASFQAGR